MNETVRTMIAGISGTGKSYLFKNSILPVLADRKPVVLFDRTGEYSTDRRDVPVNFPFYEGFGKFFDMIQENDLKLSRTAHVIACQKEYDYILGLKFLQAAADVKKLPLTIVLDEAHDIFLSKDLYRAKEPLTRLVRFGRQKEIDVIMISQRTKDIPPDIRTQFDGLISFRQSLDADVKAIEERGWPGAEEIKSLPDRHFRVLGQVPEWLTEKCETETETKTGQI